MPPSGRAARGATARRGSARRSATRSNTAPPGPSSSNSVFASAAPNWTDATATSTRTVGGTAGIVARPSSAGAVTVTTRRPAERDLRGARADLRAAWTRRSRSWTWTRCGRTRTRCSAARGARRSGWRASRSAAARCSRRRRSGTASRGFRGPDDLHARRESLWLHEHGFDDLLLAYPTADRAALAVLGADRGRRRADPDGGLVEQLDLIESAAGGGGRADPGLHRAGPELVAAGGRMKIGAKRSPDPHARAGAGARRARSRAAPGFELAGADGLRGAHRRPGRPAAGKRAWQEPVIRWIKRRSAAEIAERRAAVVAAVREVAPVPIRERRRHRQPPHHHARGRGHRDHGRLRPLRAHPVRPLRRLHAHPRGDVRAAGGAAPERRAWPRCSAAATPPRAPAGRDRLPVTAPPARVSASTRARARARCRRRCSASAAASPASSATDVYLRHAKAGELCERFDRCIW